jgi:hypothetical protein
MILEPALALANRFGAERLAFRHQTGRRNQPARAWLAEITGHPLAVSGEVELSLERARSRLGSSAVQRLWG